jgi:cation diffusion facilitator CzcD-associated flavoprotein CzcO
MNERQVAMSLGMIQRSSDMANFGNRTVMYDTDAKRWTVTFEGDRATRVAVVDQVAP